MLSPLTIWNKAESLGRSSFVFRLFSHVFAVVLVLVHYHDNGLEINFILISSLVIIISFPLVMFYSYAKKNDQGALIKHATFDFFTIGWLIGILHLSMIPSTVYFIAILGNYIGMRGFHKFYRLLLVPVGVVMSFAIGDFQLYLESSTWIMILSIGYMSIHFVVLAGISYYFAKRSNDYNKLLISKNGVIEAQKEEILTQSQRMMELNSHLEELVQQRTHELEVKNKALGEYAFINAHQLRKPVANIMGLVNLFKNDQKIDNDFIEIIGHIKDSTKELDNTVRDIRDKLERENLIHKK